MGMDLQKASLWKRISAWLFDTIVVSILAMAIALGLSVVLDYNTYSDEYETYYNNYEQAYGITFDVLASEYESWSDAQRANYDAAYNAFSTDPQVLAAYEMMISLIMLITSMSILVAVLLCEFVAPLLLGNGQTLGKKIFGICLMRTDSVRCTNVQLFVRALLGKYTVEIMIPVFMLLMLMLGSANLFTLLLLAAVPVAQIIILIATKNNSLIHDLLAGTVVVDYASQRIFPDTDSLIAYRNQIQAERASRQSY